MSLKSPQGTKIKKVFVISFKSAVSGGLLYYVLSSAGMEKVINLLKSISPVAFGIAVGLYIFSAYISTLRWKILLPDELKDRGLFSLYLIGSFFNTFLPGLVGGDAVKAYYLYKDSGRIGPSLASVFMDRYIGFVALMALGLLAYPFGLKYFKNSWVAWALPFIVILFVLLSMMLFGLRLGSRFSAIRGMYEYFEIYKGRMSDILKVFIYALGVQVIVMASVYVLALGLGLKVPALAFFMFIPVITTVAMLPVSISGIGPREASFVLLFGFVGLGAESATALSFAWFFSIAVGGLPGLIFYLKRKNALYKFRHI